MTRPLRAAIYTRVSQDASGVARSPREQEAEARRDCDRNGWTIIEVYCDNDRSASRYARKDRPGFARLVADVAAHAFDVLVVWEASRLTRDLTVYAALAAACRDAGVKLSYGGRLLNLADPDDEFSVGLDMLLSQRESGVTRKRILRATTANAAAGRPHGKTPFGYRRIYDGASGRLLRQEMDPETAPIVYELFARIAAGDSLHGVAADLNRRGIPTRQGSTWTATGVRQTVESKTHLGHRTHRGRVVVESAWPAIVDEDMFNRVQAVLGDPRRRQRHDTTVRHLLSGLLACERCQSTVSYSTVGPRQLPVYRCKARGCVARVAGPLDEAVRLLVAEGLSQPDAAGAFTTEPTDDRGALEVERAGLARRLDDADAALVADQLSPRAHGKLEAALRPRLEEIDARLARLVDVVPAPVAAIIGPDAVTVAAGFDGLDLAAQRLVVRSLLVGCELRAAPLSRRREDLGIRFRWAGVGPVVEV